MHQPPGVPTFELRLEREDSGSLALDVPCSFTAARYVRLVAFLAKEHFTVTAAASAAACLAGYCEREVHAAELLFIRKLGTLRTRSVPVPEKTVGKLLGIGVKALHARCEQLFACKWAEFLGQQCTSSSQAQSSPTASSQPSADEEMALCPVAAPSMTAAEQPAVLSAPTAATAATATPSAATAATLEPLLASWFLMPTQQYEEEEQYDVLGMLLGPCQAPAAAAAAAPTATTSCGCCATGVCACDELESGFSAAQAQQQQLPAAAPECDAYFPPTPAAAALPLATAGSAATVQQAHPVERLSSSLARLLADLEDAMREPPYFDAAPATPATPAAPAAPAAPGFDALLALDTPDFPLFSTPCPADPLNLSSATVADFPSFYL